MDNKKKDKIVAIITTALVSLLVSIIACIFGIKPEEVAQYVPEYENSSVECAVDIETA